MYRLKMMPGISQDSTGEVGFREFCALADSIQWIRHNGETTEHDRY
nr:hypothetical protein [uncultured Mediterraneibacter sp.]